MLRGFQLRRFPLLALLFVSVLGGTAIGCGDRPAFDPARRNVLLITLDTTRQDRVGAYGCKKGLTPNLDSLAGQGTVFLDARTPVPITLPSHATMLTGAEVLAHGVRGNGIFALAASETTLAERLSEAGYATGAFVSAFVLDSRFGLAQGFGTYDDEMTINIGLENWEGHAVENFERRANQTTDRALDWIDDHRSGGKPFFAWVHYFDPHRPYRPPERWRQRFENSYDAEVAYMDAEIGRLLRKLRELDVDNRTLVIAASDHGESLGEHRIKGHGSDIYAPAMRAVLIFSLPGVVPLARRVRGLVGLTDLTATSLDLIGLDRGGVGGRSLRPHFARRGPVPRERPFYMETLWPYLRSKKTKQRKKSPVHGLVSADGVWKLVLQPEDDQVELFDLKHDPHELNSLHLTEKKRVTNLRRQLEKIIEPSVTDESGLEKLEMDDTTRKKLEALGYI